MKSLILTLGHNSSAALVQNGNIIVAYEEERLSEIKSDSAFPYKAIKEITKDYGRSFDNCVVGHWFNAGSLQACKYYDEDFILGLVPDRSMIYSLNTEFTHHDSHKLAAIQFYRAHCADKLKEGDYSIVADGFGTFGECLSIYSHENDCDGILMYRAFNYANSLGLLYQYATLFLGMKMHNHEYKMLGYEAHIYEELSEADVVKLEDFADDEAEKRVEQMFKAKLNKTDPIVNLDALDECKKIIFDKLQAICELFNLSDENLYQKRVVISYFVQRVVECVMLEIVTSLNIKKLIVSGGLFYNVKLNNLLSKHCEQLCVLPIAGDQGAGFGIYQYYFGDLKFPKHLTFGDRNLEELDFDLPLESNGQLYVFEDGNEFYNALFECIDEGRIVNVIMPSMEFGPRALGSTSTIAKPTLENVELINKLNDRTFVMPMAPMMTNEQFEKYATSGKNVIGSNHYMVSTVDVTDEAITDFPGGIHRYKDVATCRPQIVENSIYNSLCHAFGPLINTSFNYHGVPIVYNAEQIVRSHNAQCKNAPEGFQVTTIILLG
ncbi:MAG: carbamoyltransferase C-terminal domain-containing protein [Acinetobacter sp.]